MAQVGDRIAVASKGRSRSGVVTGVSGAMITVRWDTGEQTSLIPAPGVLTVVSTTGATAAARKVSGSRSGVPERPGTKKAGHGKKSVVKGSSSGRATGKKTR